MHPSKSTAGRCIIYGTYSSCGPRATKPGDTFYQTEAGGSAVLDWLRGLDKDDRRAIGLDLMRVQFGWPIGRPLVGSLKDGLWEVRSSLPSRRIARLILCFHDEMLAVLHGFIKKTH